MKRLTKTEYEELSNLISISKGILETYQELYTLELQGKKESSDFKSCKECLKSSLSLEESILSKLTSNPNNIETIIDILEDNLLDTPEIMDDIDLIVGNRNDKLPLLRILKKLKIIHGNSLKEIMLGNINTELFTMIDKKSLNEPLKFIQGPFQIYETISHDLYLFLIYLIERKINNKIYKNVKSDLIRTKYLFSYIMPTIEERFINQNFEAEKEIFYSLDLTKSLYKIPELLVENLRIGCAFDMCELQMDKLLEINNQKFNKLNVEVIIRELLIRASFQLLSEDEIIILNEKLHDLLDNDQNYIGYEESIETIFKTFKLYKHDKTLIKKVSLGLSN